VLVLATFAFGLAVFFVGEVATAPNRQRATALKRAAIYGLAPRAPKNEVPQFSERVLAPAIAQLAGLALRLSPKATTEATAARLRAAGLGGRINAPAFLAIKAALALAGLGWALLIGVAFTPISGVLFAPLLAALGFIGPETILTHRIRDRRERIRAELPDALDLLAVSVEAGLGLDGAITKLTEHMNGALIDEFSLTLGEMRIGETRHDALRKLVERTEIPELAAFVRSVVQADQLGISLGRILRVQAADTRLRRQAAAEEKAMKAPIKMMFPTAIFIFPAMFAVILGPALLSLSHTLKVG
jgi:tight adherence protein C